MLVTWCHHGASLHGVINMHVHNMWHMWNGRPNDGMMYQRGAGSVYVDPGTQGEHMQHAVTVYSLVIGKTVSICIIIANGT